MCGIISAQTEAEITIDLPFQVLVLNSYSRSFSWTSSINQALEEQLPTDDYQLWYEYMDSKNFNSDEYLKILEAEYRLKYADSKFDLIISTDDAALEFLAEHRSDIFNESPIIAAGINSEIPENDRLDDCYYVIEQNDFARTLDLARKVRPNARHTYIVLDRTLTGLKIRDQLNEILSPKYPPVTWIDSGSPEEIYKLVENIHPDDILAFGLYFHDGNIAVDNDWILRNISSIAGTPVFSFWSFALPNGSIGGYVYDGYELGRFISQILLQNPIPNREMSWPKYTNDRIASSYIIDYPVAERYSLDFKTLPKETQLINKPISYLERHRSALLFSTAIIISLVVIIILIQINLLRQKAINQFNLTLLSSQKELTINLSAVIESRSSETGSHLRRLTEISVRLARYLKLSTHLIDSLYFGASLHDVGKVGMPDSILKHEGPLTDEQMAIIRTHPEKGYEILMSSKNEYLRTAAVIAYQHHEHWNGKGYPRNLRGEEIHILARIVTITDIYDALLSKRVYKEAWKIDDVREYIVENRGEIFDPGITDVFLKHWDDIYKLWQSLK